MRKLRCLLYLLPVFILCTYAEAKSVSSKTKPIHAGNVVYTSFLGPVKSVRGEVAVMEDKSGKLVEGPRQLFTLIQYDAMGNPTKMENYDLSNQSKTKLEFSYNASKKLTQVQEWVCLDSKAEKPSYEPLHKYTYKYDKKGNQIEELTYLKDSLESKMIHTYNAKGKVTESAMYRPPEKLLGRVTYVYDSKGNCIESATDRTDFGLTKIKSTYDSSGELSSCSRYNKDGGLYMKETVSIEGKRKKTSSYDEDSKMRQITVRENDKIISQILSNSDGATVRTIDFTYKYDAKGNTIKSTRCDQEYDNGKLRKKRVRIAYWTINYYK